MVGVRCGDLSRWLSVILTCTLTRAEGQSLTAASASVLRNMVPSNLIEATFQQVGSTRTGSKLAHTPPPLTACLLRSTKPT